MIVLYIEVLDNHPPPRRVNTISCLLNKLFLQKGYIQGYPRPSSCVVVFFSAKGGTDRTKKQHTRFPLVPKPSLLNNHTFRFRLIIWERCCIQACEMGRSNILIAYAIATMMLAHCNM